MTYKHSNVLAYILIAIGATLGIWFIDHNSTVSLKNNINSFAKVSCLAQRKDTSATHKFNDFLDDQISTQEDAKKLNLAKGEKARAKLNQEAIERYKKDKLHIPTIKECNVKILT